ncbi:uncharacterized protein LOC135375938 [Ornithodoros turicata]|uniref:uncharacterized protein LOC135375938 n=1 Tax=Ornithodoros turicata TaxID=34597 RepID=UPI003139E60B
MAFGDYSIEVDRFFRECEAQQGNDIAETEALLRQLENDLCLSVEAAGTATKQLLKASVEVRNLQEKLNEEQKLLEAAKSEHERVLEHVDALKCTLSKKEKLLEHHREAVDLLKTRHTDFYEAYKERIDIVRDWAGFRICPRSGNEIKFAFTLIDPEQPSEEYSFVLALEDGNYRAIESNPVVPQFPDLVDDLNRHQRLGQLVKTMRQLFCNRHVAHHGD